MTALFVALAFAGPAPAVDYPGCNTQACVVRVQRAGHARTVRRWRKVARPYRPWLARVRWCESRGNYRTNTGNGFYGAYQFLVSTWRSVGGRGYPHEAEPAEQDYRAVLLLKIAGRSPWPICG